uniref:aminodeoxychorismate lyase n=1 Tax=Thaumasiovibrio occultus TaxID=1891184 RepID=UPI000B35F8A9|nr:aminodeoxychorismate lyase [Thaumasiovibrio occultus]
MDNSEEEEVQQQRWLGQGSTVSISDRGFQYGDGCFSTIAVQQGKARLWDYHQRRLMQTLSLLCIPFSDFDGLAEQVRLAAASFNADGVVKVMITRGEGGRGYSASGAVTPNVVVTTSPMPPHYAALRREGIALGICHTQLGHNPLLAGHKHLNRLEQILVRQEIDREGWLDAIVTDLDNKVVETGIANLFWEIDGKLYTPDLSLAGVNGVMRQRIIDWAQQAGVPVVAVRVSIPELVTQAKALFICNALLGPVFVSAVAGQTYVPGEIYLQLTKSLCCD